MYNFAAELFIYKIMKFLLKIATTIMTIAVMLSCNGKKTNQLTNTNMKNMTVGEMAVQEHSAISVFKELKIDYCCNGNKNLKEVLSEKNVSLEAFITKLETVKKERDTTKVIDFKSMKPSDLIEYIVEKHHIYLENALPDAAELFAKVLRVHGAHHLELYDAYKLFGALKTDLEQHLIKEETIFFPKIINADKEAGKLSKEIKNEHEAVGELLDNIRETTNNYALPEDACMSYKNLYNLLQEIEDDIHEHVHLENNILMKNL